MAMDDPGREEGRPPLIELRGLLVSYPERGEVLRGVDLALYEGDRLLLLGGNGAGKTTLFHAILGLVRPRAGEVRLFGRRCIHDRDFQAAWPRIGLLFQDPDDQLFSPSVLDDVAFGLLNRGMRGEAARRRAMEQLDALGIAHLHRRPPYHLSGGEKRLAALASILVMEPEVLLLDEPFAGIERRAAERMAHVIDGSGARAMIIISHQMELASALSTRRLLLEDGDLREPD